MRSSGSYMASPYGSQGMQVAPYTMQAGPGGGAPVMMQAPAGYYAGQQAQHQQSYTRSYDPRQHGGMEGGDRWSGRSGGRKGSNRPQKSPDRRASPTAVKRQPISTTSSAESMAAQGGPPGRAAIPMVASQESLKSSDGDNQSKSSSNETSFQAGGDEAPFFVADDDV